MTKEDKELLLKDLCARLPYKVICFKEVTNCISGNSILLEEDVYSFRTGNPTVADCGQHDYYKTVVLELKPYLRSMSSMTEIEKMDFNEIQRYNVFYSTKGHYTEVDWLNKNHFDYRGLIPKDLAIAVTKENNPYEN